MTDSNRSASSMQRFLCHTHFTINFPRHASPSVIKLLNKELSHMYFALCLNCVVKVFVFIV